MKKLARTYINIKDQINDSEDKESSIKLTSDLESIAKLSILIEYPAMYDELQINKRRVKDEARSFDIKRGCSIDRQAVFVWTGGSWPQLQDFLSNGMKMVPFDGAYVVVKDTLQSAIDICIPGDVILLCHGEHILDDVGDLKSCLNIFGVGNFNEIKLTLDCGYDYELIASGSESNIYFENVTIASKIKQNGILIKDGAKITLQQCRVTHFSKSIEVRNNSSCLMKWSEVTGCDVAIFLEKNGNFHSIGE